MEDFAGLIVLIIVGIISSINKKNKAQKKAAPRQPIIPYGPEAVPQPAKPARPVITPEQATVNHDTLRKLKEEQFEKEMRAIREKVRQSFEGPKKATPMQTAAPRVHATEGVDPCHDALYDADAVAEPIADQPAPLEAMEGVDPCHDELYEADAADTADNWVQPNNEAAQELLRGVILSEVLTRPTNRWRTQQR